MVERMRELGLFGATTPAAYGGLGLSAVLYARIVERISRVWMALTGIFNSHLIMAAPVERSGTGAPKQKFLPRVASGALCAGPAPPEAACGPATQATPTLAPRRG